MFKRLFFLSAAAAIAVGVLAPGEARAQSLVDVCTGMSVDIPVINQVGTVTSGLLTGLLDPLLNGIVGDINTNVVNALSGQNIGLTVLDENGNPVGTTDPCYVTTDKVVVDNNAGIALGGGEVTSLGGTGNTPASAIDANAIAIGNGASTNAAATSAVALGLRGSVTAADGVAIGRDASTTVDGGVALGADSVADRAGMNGGAEDFSGSAVASTAGAVSVGAVGAERQIINVAGGTTDTDAVNVRQLRAVGNNLASALGGGATFNSATGLFTSPSYVLRGVTYTDVYSALLAIDNTIGSASGASLGVIAGNNTSGYLGAAASGEDTLAAGYGSIASGNNAVAYGTRANAAGANSTAIGSGATAGHANSSAIGAGATATRANQVMVGTASNTYTMPGISSAASRAAQSGATGIVTADANGNLATISRDELFGDALRESRRGIAAAMAMASAPMPSAAGRTSWAANVAVFAGEWAGAYAMTHRVNSANPLAVQAAISVTGDGVTGGRAGLVGEF